jgi:hypothetical protein
LAVIGARERDEQPAADIRVKRLARHSETPSGFGGGQESAIILSIKTLIQVIKIDDQGDRHTMF